MNLLASIPSPSWEGFQLIPQFHLGALTLGPITIRMYAICIMLGVVAAVIIGNRRWIARGGQPGVVLDLVLWAVPFGMVGARLYHVITDHQKYFGSGESWNPVGALKIWEGGLGIWGGILGGGIGVWIAVRRRGIPLPPMADALAPGIVLAQGIGRIGNWINQELFGRPTDLPWALSIDEGRRPAGFKEFSTFHPTFLYELLWCVGVALLVIWADKRFKMGHGRAFALYVAAYTAGRVWIEYMRIDEANHFLGVRINVWTSIVVFVGAVVYIIVSARLRPGREDPALLSPVPAVSAGSKDDDTSTTSSTSTTTDASAAAVAGTAATSSDETDEVDETEKPEGETGEPDDQADDTESSPEPEASAEPTTSDSSDLSGSSSGDTGSSGSSSDSGSSSSSSSSDSGGGSSGGGD